MEQIEFKLKNILDYTNTDSGEFEKTGMIILKPPSYHCIDETTRLAQYVMRAFMDSTKYQGIVDSDAIKEARKKIEVAKKEKGKTDSGVDGDSVRMILLSSTSVDFPDVIKEFKKVIETSAWVSEKIRFKEAHLEKLDPDEIVNMICEYIAVFISPSLF